MFHFAVKNATDSPSLLFLWLIQSVTVWYQMLVEKICLPMLWKSDTSCWQLSVWIVSCISWRCCEAVLPHYLDGSVLGANSDSTCFSFSWYFADADVAHCLIKITQFSFFNSCHFYVWMWKVMLHVVVLWPTMLCDWPISVVVEHVWGCCNSPNAFNIHT